ncbi:MAG: phosphoglycolate phosphatase [Solirubrobacteraceae bacterium]|nr:phosphoglycolate phosphatase [Solirubrobacteraceae bacterium]
MLLLFDIDGTLLLGAARTHGEALHAAIEKVFGVPDPAARHVQPAGRTDGEIAREILLQSGVSAERIEERAGELRAACCDEFSHRCPRDLRDAVAPGMGELLDRLADDTAVKLALLTGNYEPVARLKLEHAGLGHHFPAGQGAFGSDHTDRAALPAIARRRAGADGRPHPRGQTIVIGDTPNDIACARADGLACLAVATGPFAAADLQAADGVAGNAAELGDLLAARLATG